MWITGQVLPFHTQTGERKIHISSCYLLFKICEHHPISQNKLVEANLVTSLQSDHVSQHFNKLMSLLPSFFPFFSISSSCLFSFLSSEALNLSFSPENGFHTCMCFPGHGRKASP